MAPHASALAWESQGWGNPGGCRPWGRTESDTAERLHSHFSLSYIGEGNGNTLQCSCLENPRDSGAWWAAVYGVAERWTQPKWLSSSNYKTAQVNGLLKTKVVCILKHYQGISITYIVHNKIECKWSYNLMSHFYLSIMLLGEYYKS